MPDAAPLQVVWFKRDLRVHDHWPLHKAAEYGRVLPLYIAEPSVWQAPDMSARHWAFVRGSLAELRERLALRGQPLVVRFGEAVPVLEALRCAHGPLALWAHQETGNALTYARDRAVQAWAAEHGIRFVEVPQHGVVRGLRDRNAWSEAFERRMRHRQAPTPEALRPPPILADPGPLPTVADLGLAPLTGEVQVPGEAEAEVTLASFFAERGQPYSRAMSSPVIAFDHCSRLSPHLAFGTISLRRVVQATREQQAAWRGERGAEATAWRRSLRAFDARLHWQSHFMQKLETEPAIEHRSFIPAFDALREDAFDAERYEAWCAGATGYPLVDACMRALRQTGYLNFRMRALLVSFAAYDLWLDWRRFHAFLARQWTDYEPGIQLSQLQMQSGTTGINTVRIYNPTKQALEHDPEGVFIRRWVPELEGVPLVHLHRPWTLPAHAQQAAGCVLGRHYPHPLVDHAQAARQAQERIYALRRTPEVQAQAAAVLEKHGSRKRRGGARRSRPSTPDAGQPTLGL